MENRLGSITLPGLFAFYLTVAELESCLQICIRTEVGIRQGGVIYIYFDMFMAFICIDSAVKLDITFHKEIFSSARSCHLIR